MHTNISAVGRSRREVKNSLNEDQRNDGFELLILDAILGVCVLFLVRDKPTLDAIAIVVATIAGLLGMRNFVDQSIRNFYPHRLDWEDAGRGTGDRAP